MKLRWDAVINSFCESLAAMGKSPELGPDAILYVPLRETAPSDENMKNVSVK
jgi:hypothetical protein